MKDSDLYIPPNNWYKHHNCTAKEECQAGTTEALHYKLEFIDSRIAEIEATLDHPLVVKDWSVKKIEALTNWYELIYNVILSRGRRKAYRR